MCGRRGVAFRASRRGLRRERAPLARSGAGELAGAVPQRGGPAAREAPGLGAGSALEAGQKSSVPRARLGRAGSAARVPARGTGGGDAPPRVLPSRTCFALAPGCPSTCL